MQLTLSLDYFAAVVVVIYLFRFSLLFFYPIVCCLFHIFLFFSLIFLYCCSLSIVCADTLVFHYPRFKNEFKFKFKHNFFFAFVHSLKHMFEEYAMRSLVCMYVYSSGCCNSSVFVCVCVLCLCMCARVFLSFDIGLS